MEEYEFECYKKAGEIVIKTREFIRNYIKKDMKLFDLAESIEDKIRELGGEVAFPVNLSINEIAAHYTPLVNDENIVSGLLKVDFGVCVDGFICDNAICFDFSEGNKFREMIELNKKILKEVGGGLVFGSKVKDVGDIASSCLKEFNLENGSNYTLVNSLCGHGLGKDLIHTGLIIPNYKNNNLNELSGAFAIEPFVTIGSGEIYEGVPGGIYRLNNNSLVRDRDARKILEYIKKNYKSRPFCARWLFKEGFEKINFCLRILEKQGIIYQYPVLVERTKSVVSQVENSFVVFDKKIWCISCE
ncbi:MAG: type II methionyl aminopeptidase [Candidatus Pacearchaeota archaeon]